MKYKMFLDEHMNRRYYYILNVYSRASMEKLLARPDLVQFRNGYLLPDTPENHRLMVELSTMDGANQRMDEREKREQEYRVFLEKMAPYYAFVNAVQGRIMRREPIQGLPGSCSKLMNHQKGGTLIAEKFNKFAFFYDTGTGKTLMALDIIHRKAATKGRFPKECHCILD